MNESPENAALVGALDTLFCRSMLFRAWRLAHSCGENKCSQDGLYILEALLLSPGLTTKGLVNILGKHFSQVMLVLKGLEEKGLVEVKRKEGKRGAPIFLTEHGEKQLAAIRSSYTSLTNHLMADSFVHGLERLTKEETAQLQTATDLLLERQRVTMEENMFQPAPIACFPLC